MTYFTDQVWFFNSAREALLGKPSLLGITSSITWLHQGALWTYMLVPEQTGMVITTLMTMASVVLMYFWAKRFGVILLIANPWFWFNWLVPYHLSPIPLFTLITLHLFKLRRNFLFGLFLGLLYQLHLLTFLFWPLLIFRFKLRTLLGFILGILPFLISGPIQTFGIFIWLVKHLFEGFSGSNVSDAYITVLLVPAIMILNKIYKRLVK